MKIGQYNPYINKNTKYSKGAKLEKYNFGDKRAIERCRIQGSKNEYLWI